MYKRQAKYSFVVPIYNDGALASAHRSTGQAWTDGAQISFLTHAANLFSKLEVSHRTQAVRKARDLHLLP